MQIELTHQNGFFYNCAMAKKYKKLVRDNIPLIIEESGKTFSFHFASDAEYKSSLRAKAVEEANELANAYERKEIISESADLLEVLESIWKEEGITSEEVLARKAEKKESNGGFEKMLILDEVSD